MGAAMNIHILPAALEAGAKELAMNCRCELACDWRDHMDDARAAFLAMIEAWPGMVNGSTRWPHRREIILPLQQETRDEPV